MSLSLIVAVADNGVIATGTGEEPWHLPADLKRYRDISTGHTIIMGRNSFEKIGHPLSNRRNLILTRDTNFSAPGVEVVHSLPEAYKLAKDDGEVFIVGGGQIYEASLNDVDTMYITHVHGNPLGKVYFKYSLDGWEQTFKEDHEATSENYPAYTFAIYKRKKA